MLLHVLRHVDADQRRVVVEQERRQRLGQLGLADAGRAEEHERADRPVRVLQAGAGAAHRGRDGVTASRLADDALGELVLHAQQLLASRPPASCRPGCRSSARRRRRCGRASPPPRPCRRLVGPSPRPRLQLLLERRGSRRRRARPPLARSPVRCAFSSSVAGLVELLLDLGRRRRACPSRPSSASVSASDLLLEVGELLRRASRGGPSRPASLSFFRASRSIFSWMMRRSSSSSASGFGIDLHAQPRRGLVDRGRSPCRAGSGR